MLLLFKKKEITFKVSVKAKRYIIGLGEIFEKMKFEPGILSHIFLVVKFNFKNISLNIFFDPRPFW